MEYDSENYKLLYDKILELNDIVIFKYKKHELKYKVYGSFLNLESKGEFVYNDTIFKKLKIDKSKYAKQQYGYASPDSDWPEFKDYDYAAATRLVIGLFETIEANDNAKISAPKSFKIVYKDKFGKRQETVIEANTLHKAKGTIKDMDEFYYHMEY